MDRVQLEDELVQSMSSDLPESQFAAVWVSSSVALPMVEVAMSSFLLSMDFSRIQGRLTLGLIHDGVSQDRLTALVTRLQMPDSVDFWSSSVPNGIFNEENFDEYPPIHYFRMLIPSIFYKYETVVYLDADLWVLEDLSPLFSLQENRSSLWATQETWFEVNEKAGIPVPSWLGSKDISSYLAEQLGLAAKDYLNSGLLVLKTSAMDLQKFNKFWIDTLNSAEYWFADQCILSKWCQGEFGRLDSTWNHQVGLTWPKPPPPGIKVLHFSGVFRPWKILLGRFSTTYLNAVTFAAREVPEHATYTRRRLYVTLKALEVLLYRILPSSMKGVAMKIRHRLEGRST